MHRAKHRAAGRAGADVLVTTLIERLAVDAGAVAPRGGVAVLDAGMPEDRDLGDAGLYGVALFGATTPTDPFLAVPDDEPPARSAAPLFHDDARGGTSPFGACRHAAARPVRRTAPSVPAQRVRSQPVGTALTVTILGAAAVSAVVSPTVPVESTGELPPVQGARPRCRPRGAGRPRRGRARGAGAADDAGRRARRRVTAEMQKLTPAVEQQFTTVANKTEMSAAAARKAAVSKALSKLGTPYRWGAMGPNAFDCSGLVKWSFGQAGKSLPRTSRAQVGGHPGLEGEPAARRPRVLLQADQPRRDLHRQRQDRPRLAQGPGQGLRHGPDEVHQGRPSLTSACAPARAGSSRGPR